MLLFLLFWGLFCQADPPLLVKLPQPGAVDGPGDYCS
jgi:hypothetical protein